MKIIIEGSGADTKYYAQMGADTASKKLLGSSVKLLWTNPSVQNQVSITAACDWTKYDKIIILACENYLYPSQNKYIQCLDIGVTSSISYKTETYRTIEFNSGITMYVPADRVERNWGAYNIPLKIWGAYTEEDFYSYP